MKLQDNILSEALKNIPLDTEIKITIEMSLIQFLVNNGFREEKMWNENDKKDMELLSKIMDFSKTLTNDIMEYIKKHDSSI